MSAGHASRAAAWSACIVVVAVFAGCTASNEGGSQMPVPDQPDADEMEETKSDRPVLSNFGVAIDAYDPATGLAGDILFSRDLVYDDGRVYGDRPFVEFGWTHDYYGAMGNLEYWFYTPLETTVRAPVSGTVSIERLDHTDDWAVHFVADPAWIVSFEHVVDVVVDEGQWVEAGDPVAYAAPRNTFDGELALVELAVWQGGEHITKHCPWDFLAPELQDDYAAKFTRLAADWEDYLGEEVYDEGSWVAPGCLVHTVQET